MDEQEACLRSNEDMTEFVKEQFFTLCSSYLEIAVELQQRKSHEEIVHDIQTLMEDDVNKDVAIKRVLRKSRKNSEDLFDNDYFKMNGKGD